MFGLVSQMGGANGGENRVMAAVFLYLDQVEVELAQSVYGL